MSGLPYGLGAMLKDGHKHLSGLQEAVIKNIEACRELSMIARTSLGPNGMSKMVINHLEKLFVTSDASTIINELEVQHPAAKLLVFAARAQEQEIGDGTNLVIALGGELLGKAESLLSDGLHTSEISDGYQKAAIKALEILEELVIAGTKDLDMRNKLQVQKRIRSAVSSKINGYEDILCPLVAQACVDVCPKNPVNFNVDNVRVVKIPGASLPDSMVVNGMVLRRDTEGTVKHVENAKIAAYAEGVDTASTDTKGTVLIKNAAELENYSKDEENKLEEYIKKIADTGCKVIMSGGAFGEMAMHFIEKYNMMAIRVPSKFELMRLCKSTNTTIKTLLGVPQPDEQGFASSLTVKEIGGTNCIVLKQDASKGNISTIVLRGSTEGFLDDVERAVNDAVNCYKALAKDSRAVAAAGAAEIELARRIAEYGNKQTGLEQYAIIKYAEAFELVPRTLAENSGLNATDVVSALYAAHAQGKTNMGVDIETGEPKDLAQEDIMDLYTAKWWAIKLATEAVTTVLKVDQIIMAKQAGGPKPRAGAGDDE
ncbi:hypothetical protein CEUSTIGMA_g9652.t1 [Chlamydomonas eustigma]|uniref:CCT-theta n=1 Tax=Chlamydomonas eustigma TaxID=1157962 RepID=A0A250XGM0_9CHLO|nr:hypothetical protein CEUSTIGMA_g9652.t1 [Chlamydomonas eustigma]|eukprot:GAX82224.1 hypothetical protein CEUSTIGMA_g9652.t1 [Chlamydomonas eustigma]